MLLGYCRKRGRHLAALRIHRHHSMLQRRQESAWAGRGRDSAYRLIQLQAAVAAVGGAVGMDALAVDVLSVE